MKNKNAFVFLSLLFTLSGIASPTHARAEAVLLPVSRHQQILTYGLFTDQQSSLVFRSEGKAWGAIGGSIALLELPDLKYKPQLIAHGLASAAFRINSRGDTLLTDTVDARVGLSIDLKFADDLRGAIMWTHQSGHISDDVPDADLIGSNLGNEIITFRLVKDFEQTFRVGASLRPCIGSDPPIKLFGAEQFGEWFFKGASLNPHTLSPFLAAGLEEYGLNEVDLTFHAQIGYAIGNHFGEAKTPSMRTVFGYYTGVDPRLKYFQFKNRKAGFIYAGLMFDL